MRNDDGADFDRWYQRADEACISIAGLGIDDLPDGNSWDAWNDGASPVEYAREKLADEGWDEVIDAVDRAAAVVRPDLSPFTVVGVVDVDVDSGTITPVRYGDGSDAAVVAAEDVRRANWTPSNQYRNGRYVKSTYAPLTETVEAAIRIRKTGAPLPRLF